MTFAGIRNAQERANLIAYLRRQHDAPPALPSP
jgi:cytochrome c2